MQITSQSGAMVLDYYPIRCPISNKIQEDYMFKVLSFMGSTMKKSVINLEQFGQEIEDRVCNGTYIVVDNTKGLPQLVNINKYELGGTKW